MDKDDLARYFVASRASLLGYLRTIVRDPHRAEDLLQETWVVVMKRLDDFDPSRDFGAWTRGIARNLARNALRSAHTRKMTYLASEELLDAIDVAFEGATASECEDSEQDVSLLRYCLAKVSVQNRRMLALRYSAGMRIEEIAQKFRRSSGSIQVALYRIRQSLLKCIERRRSLGYAH